MSNHINPTIAGKNLTYDVFYLEQFHLDDEVQGVAGVSDGAYFWVVGGEELLVQPLLFIGAICVGQTRAIINRSRIRENPLKDDTSLVSKMIKNEFVGAYIYMGQTSLGDL